VEIDQQGLPGNGCSTMVLISKNIINKASAESAVEEFVKKVLLTEREMNFASKGIILKTKNHPEEFNDNSLMVWRARLLRKVLE
jgi:transcriptional regulator CtsR